MAIIKRQVPPVQPAQTQKAPQQSSGTREPQAQTPARQGSSQERYEELAKLAEQKREERRKQVLTLRVSAETMNKARALGKGYTGILSRLLEEALNDPEMIERCL
ncbi:MAG: hypothetical protein IJJ38_08340 [Lachnospiraceae bacterium]|nr:hypothetical protein [Lachnospiraceae bacterium]